ncbi:uncharacterized protein TNCV_425011 [Trichonephila clavipes]|nr:uncharacterized protein TNCV_425011 [Trichonephila clavipes]
MNAAEQINDIANTPAIRRVEIMQKEDDIAPILTPDCVSIDSVRSSFMKTHWAAASACFTKTFVNNPIHT